MRRASDGLSTDLGRGDSRIRTDGSGLGPAIQGGWLRGTGDRGYDMNELAVRMRDEDQGMSTAEYAVGTVAVCGLGGLLIKLLTGGQVSDLLWQVISSAFSFLF